MAALYAGLARTALGAPTAQASAFFPSTIFPRDPNAAFLYNNGASLTPGAAWLTLDALTSVARPGEEAAWQDYAGARRISWKTGTSVGNRDAWAIGTTPDLTVAVWIGNASGEGNAILRSAVTAAPVLFELFSSLKNALNALNASRQSEAWFPQPVALRPVEVCAFSGYPVGPDCARLVVTRAPRDAPGGVPCPYCRVIVLNAEQDRQVVLDASAVQKVVAKKWFVLPPAEEWYYRKWNLDYAAPPPFEGADGRAATMALFSPDAGSQIYVPVELDGREGRVVFRAAHRESGAVIHWHLDDGYLGVTEAFHEMEVRPASGLHTLTLVDNAGNRLSRRFEVLARTE
jgi:penicillin-binding protein 1C